MAIKNYTSGVSPFTSISDIQAALATHGASKIMIDYTDGKPTAVSFALPDAQRGFQGFMLPAAVDGTLRVFKAQGLREDREQAERTAWKNIRDWVLAQIALVEACDVPIDQVFLPYLTDGTGKTLYDAYSAGKLLLGGGDDG